MGRRTLPHNPKFILQAIGATAAIALLYNTLKFPLHHDVNSASPYQYALNGDTATVESSAANSTRPSWKNPLLLNREECLASFPGLFTEIERTVAARAGRKISQSDLSDTFVQSTDGAARVLIYRGQMYVLKSNGNRVMSRRIATLHSLNQAITTAPEPLPNIEFVMDIGDQVDDPALTWSFARSMDDKKPDKDAWLMPDFGLWSWPEPKVGSYQEVLMKADEVDEEYVDEAGRYTLEGKRDRAVWRGATLGLAVRNGLLEAAKDKPWADVKILEWNNKEKLREALLSMSDHCRYKYVLHTEGYSYSGRLKYLQACHSVVISHAMEWTQHYFPMLRDSGPEQNYVSVKRDWSDLEDKIQWLRENPTDANEIARRSREVFRKYQSQAANNCYWREMVRAWGEMQDFQPSLYEPSEAGPRAWRGVPWESFALLEKTEWEPY